MKRLWQFVGCLVLVLGPVAAQEVAVEVLQETDTHRLVRHAGGETQVPLNPQRVITIHSDHFDNAVALGVIPVGVGVLPDQTLEFSHPEYLHETLAEIASVGSWVTPNFEAILALEPDLILANPWHADIYQQLSRIAPTVIAEALGIAGLRETAKVLGRNEQAEAVIKEYERAVEAATVALAEVIERGERVAFLRVTARDIRIHGIPEDRKDGPGYLLHVVLGLVPAPLVPNEWFVAVSLEVLPELRADHIFLLAQSDEVFGGISATPLWGAIPAVQKGQVYPVSYGMWQGSMRVQGMKHFVEYVLRMMTEGAP
jgi:iron complex transport system substrate-binding protein